MDDRHASAGAFVANLTPEVKMFGLGLAFAVLVDATIVRMMLVPSIMEILGDGLGLDSEDGYKRLKQIGDIDEIIAETAPLIEANRLDLDTVRDALLFEFGARANP